MNKVVHFEVPYGDKEKCQGFYSKVFGWQFQDMPEMNYLICRTCEVDDKMMPKEAGAINGGMFKRADDLKSPLITIDVSSIDETLEKVKMEGGDIIREKSAVGDMGFIAYIRDSENNIVGLWQNAKKEY
jgi:uncharacterized protein